MRHAKTILPLLLAAFAAAEPPYRTYSAPPGAPSNADYVVSISDGQESNALFVHDAVVTDAWGKPKYHQSFVQFEITGKAVVRVKVCYDRVSKLAIYPGTAPVRAAVRGDEVELSLDRPAKFALEVNGQKYRPLFLFAEAPETWLPKPDDPAIRYFGPGIHDVSEQGILLQSGQTAYLAPGALVYGFILATNASNIAVRGRGILDGSRLRRDYTGRDAKGNPNDWQRKELIKSLFVDKLLVEGILLRDAPTWNMRIQSTRDVTLRGLKEISYHRNSDGIDLVSVDTAVIDDVFIRCADDGISIKTATNGPSRNIHVVNSSFWTDMSRGCMVGPEMKHDAYQITFSNVHILEHRTPFGEEGAGAFAVRALGGGSISNILFADCVVERISDGGSLVYCGFSRAKYETNLEMKIGGSIQSVEFRRLQCLVPGEILICGFPNRPALQGIHFDQLKTTNADSLDQGYRAIRVKGMVSNISLD